MAQSDYPNLSFPPRYAIVCAMPAMCTHRDPGENPLVQEHITLPRGSQGPHLMTRVQLIWAYDHASGYMASVGVHPGCQELSHMGNDVHMAAATCGNSQCCS